MPTSPSTDIAAPPNRLLDALPPGERERVVARCDLVAVRFGQVFWDVGQPIEHVWFPRGMIVSVLGVMRDGRAIEMATIGTEGTSGVPVFLGDDRTGSHAFCQVPGHGMRMHADDFRAEVARGGALADLMRRYTHAHLTFIGQSSACNRLHTMTQRCARWLLHTHDRVGRDTFQLTHLVLSQMLGVRRATVTETMIELHGLGAITYEMGHISITSRAALERAACECYGVIQAEHDRLMVPGSGASPEHVVGGHTSADGFTTVGDGSPDHDG